MKFTINNIICVIIIIIGIVILLYMINPEQTISSLKKLFIGVDAQEDKYPHHNDDYCVKHKGMKILVIANTHECFETLDYYLLNGYTIKVYATYTGILLEKIN